MFFKLLKDAFKIKQVRSKILFTIFIILVFRIGTTITVPGVNAKSLEALSGLSFLNINRKEYAIVNLDQLNAFEDGAEVTPVVLIEAGIVKAEKSGIKILGNGELTKKLTVKAAKFSKSAEEAITAKGGSVEVI